MLFVCISAQAEIKFDSILGDNMVLQRNTEVKIWGKATPNQKLTIQTSWNLAQFTTISNDKGEWITKAKTTEAGGPYTITVSSGKEKVQLKNILLGEVWLCSGQSNMDMTIEGYADSPVIGSNDMLMDADNTDIRLFTLKLIVNDVPQDNCTGSWSVASAESVAKFSAVGYLYAKHLQQKLKVPVGMICSAWGGSRIESWISKDIISTFPEAYKQTTQEKLYPNERAANIYNGMISPLVNMAIKGAIWYQGESNIRNYKDYGALQSAMVTGWRRDFGLGEFPFYFVEIAPYWYNNSKAAYSAFQRNQQFKAMSLIPNSGMVSTIDLGEEKNIHPAEKETVAKRLACWALSETYGVKGIPYKSPAFKSLIVKDSVAIISFDNAVNGLTTFGKEVDCFEIAGQDSIYYQGKIAIKEKQVQVWSPKVKFPVSVRYAFCNFPKTSGFLYNTAGLPLILFRTDNW
jgi:sialate O-acetylesterase